VDVFIKFLTAFQLLAISPDVGPFWFKAAYIMPRSKKSDLDLADYKSFQPICNLTVLSKLSARSIPSRRLWQSTKTGRRWGRCSIYRHPLGP